MIEQTHRRYLAALLAVFVILDLVLTFWQNYQLPLDGDLVAIVFPAPWYAPVLHDPFGWSVLTKHETYAATNRFFAHATMSMYWKAVPLLMQYIVDPISSLYAASAFFTTATHSLLVFLLAVYIRRGSGSSELGWWWSLWLAAALVVPLFQTGGFNEQIGVTNRAVTYTFFYALPIALLLLLLLPFYRAACIQQPLKLSYPQVILLLGLMIVIAFNGPIATASVTLILSSIAAYWVWNYLQHYRIKHSNKERGGKWLSLQAIGLCGVLGVLCLYSLYIGRNNSENTHDHTLKQLYQLLPTGVEAYFTYQPALRALVISVLLNAQLVRWLVPASVDKARVLIILRWVGVFAVSYVLLLPFGGYRSYRPFLLRNDSVLPIIIGLIFAYGLSAYFLLFQLRGRLRGVYVMMVCLFSAYFTYNDSQLEMPNNNGCERWSLDQLSRSPEPVVHLSNYCTVLSWTPITDYNQSALNAEMLHFWRVIDKKKMYYQ